MGRGIRQKRMIAPTNNHPEVLRYASLNHWRGVAALLVVAFHAFWALSLPPQVHPLVEGVRRVCSFGYLGVDLFFVISGYCIAANIHRSILTKRSATDFLRDRFLRIYLPYWAALLAQTGLTLVMVSLGHEAEKASLPASGWELLTNVLLIEPYAGTHRAMIVTWSLTCEFGFYLMVAAAFALSARRGPVQGWLWLALALALISFLPLPQFASAALTFWPEFVFGGLIYFARLTRQAPYIAFVPLLAGVGACASSAAAALHLFCAAVFALGLYFLAPLDARIVRIPWLRWLGSVGVFSYSLYLVHVPILMHLSNGARRVRADGPFLLLVVAVMGLAAVGGGYLFYLLGERPLERLRFCMRQFSRPATGLAVVSIE